MLVELFHPRAPKGNEDQRDDDDRKNRVREKQDKIDRPDPALPLKRDMPNAVMVDEIGDEEDGGNGKGGEHEFFVQVTFAGADGGVARGEGERHWKRLVWRLARHGRTF